ncbi:MAG: glycoside hydrolase family 31 protein [Bacteroidota bacterium]|nr:glycoside hydrolase family 31 protein [Bacteroidota bacterium]
MLNNQMGLSGIPFVGPDLGGYIGDGTKDLFKRWMEVGVFSPFMRNHKEYFANANEPWSYGEEAEQISKTYIGFRYRLLPYIYSCFYEAAQTGMPVARSLCLYYPFENKVFDKSYQYQFMFGNAMMVTPVTSQETAKKVWLPAGDWYDIFTDKKINGNNEILMETPIYKIPVFIKASAIIPLQSWVPSTRELPSDTLFLHVYKGIEKSCFTFYEDDGEDLNYKKGVFNKRIITYIPDEDKLVIGSQEGIYQSRFNSIKIILHGFQSSIHYAIVNDKTKEIKNSDDHLIDALDNLQDYYDKNLWNNLRLKDKPQPMHCFVTDNRREEITITFQ